MSNEYVDRSHEPEHVWFERLARIDAQPAITEATADAWNWVGSDMTPCRVYSHGDSGWHCAVTGPHDEHRNAAGDVTW